MAQANTVKIDAAEALKRVQPIVEASVQLANAVTELLQLVPGVANPVLVDRRHLAPLQAAVDNLRDVVNATAIASGLHEALDDIAAVEPVPVRDLQQS